MGAGRSAHSDGSPAQSPTPLLSERRLLEPHVSGDHGFPGASLLTPSPVRPPISSPPPRPADDSVIPSPPTSAKASRVPLVRTTRVASSSGERRHSMRADSPMPKLQADPRRPSDPSEEQKARSRGEQQQSELESQIREIEQMTDGILEDIEAENLGSFCTGRDPAVKSEALAKGGRQQADDYADAGRSTMVPLRGAFEHSLFTNAAKFVGLGRPQLPPTRSQAHGNRRASVPRDAVGGFRSGGHRHKPHSRSTGSEGRSQSQPVAGMAVRLGAQSRTPLGQGAEAAQRRRHNAAAAATPATTQSAEASYDFSRYHQANQREQVARRRKSSPTLMRKSTLTRTTRDKIEGTSLRRPMWEVPWNTTSRKNSSWKTSKRNTPSRSIDSGLIAIHTPRRLCCYLPCFAFVHYRCLLLSLSHRISSNITTESRAGDKKQSFESGGNSFVPSGTKFFLLSPRTFLCTPRLRSRRTVQAKRPQQFNTTA
ncbi:uncharacterized protein LOC144096958 [Amblyomma americanum]